MIYSVRTKSYIQKTTMDKVKHGITEIASFTYVDFLKWQTASKGEICSNYEFRNFCSHLITKEKMNVEIKIYGIWANKNTFHK